MAVSQDSRADTWEYNPGSAHTGECSKAVAGEGVLVLSLQALSLSTFSVKVPPQTTLLQFARSVLGLVDFFVVLSLWYHVKQPFRYKCVEGGVITTVL